MPPKIKSTESAEAAKALLLWARKERIVLSHVQVGDVSLVVTMDHRMQHADGDERKPGVEARQSIIEQYGGPLFDPEQRPKDGGAEMEPTIEDDDDE